MRSICFLLALASCEVGEPSHSHGNGVLDLSSPLLVTTRDRLRVCVQVDPALAGEPIATTLRGDLARLRDEHPDWPAAGFGDAEVVLGCPGAGLVDAPLDGKVALPGTIATPLPGPYRVHVHVLAAARAAAVLGDQPFARAIAEVAPVDDHRVAEVSTALVISAPVLGTDAFRTLALAQALGLRTEAR
jgi:hypothetical protein